MKRMIGERQVIERLFYEFSLERHLPADHVVRATGFAPRKSLSVYSAARLYICREIHAVRSEPPTFTYSLNAKLVGTHH